LVRLLSLQARNFKKLRLDSPIHFSNGITLISGLNESGKSSVLDAILYALFGRVTRPPKARNEDIVAYGAKEATVSLEFEVEDRVFRVTRRLHKLKLTQALLEELGISKRSELVAKGQENVNEEIVRLLGGITYQEILSSTVVAQKELNKLIELNKNDRKQIVNAFLNLESFNAVIADLTEERRDLEGSPSRAGRVQAETEKLEQLKRDLKQFEQNNQERAGLLKENSALADTVNDLESKFKEKDRLYSDLRQQEAAIKTKDNLILQLSNKKKTLDDHRSRAEQLSKEISSVQQELTGFAALDKMELALSKLEDEVVAARAQLVELSTTERSMKSCEQEVGELERKLAPVDESRLRSRVVQLDKPIRPFILVSILLFIGAIIAFTFGSPLIALVLFLVGLVPAVIGIVRVQRAASFAKGHSVLGDLKYLDSKRIELVRLQQGYAQARQNYESTEQHMASLCETLRSQSELFRFPEKAGIADTAQSILETRTEFGRARDALRVKLQTITDEAQKLPSQTAMTTLELEVKNLEERIGQLLFPKLPEGTVFAPELLAETLAARDDLARRLAASQDNVQQNLRRISELEHYLKDHAEVPSKARAQEEVVSKLERRVRVVRHAVEGIQATGESLRNRVRPSVQSYMSAILPSLTSSRYRAAVLDDDYSLQVWDPEAGEYKSKDVYSGGTEDQFLLAMRLAFALALLPEVKGQKPEFVFLDEPLGSSDEVRRSGVVDYLVRDLSKKFKQIFIISHVGGLEEHVQNIITLEDGTLAGNESIQHQP
jgi:exonuclease SbcC